MELPKCKYCAKLFAAKNMPRTLPLCGHTLCETCLNGRITTMKDHNLFCPEDGIVC